MTDSKLAGRINQVCQMARTRAAIRDPLTPRAGGKFLALQNDMGVLSDGYRCMAILRCGSLEVQCWGRPPPGSTVTKVAAGEPAGTVLSQRCVQ